MTSLVWAANAHYLRGPVLVDNGITATATGTIAGLGNGNVIATLSFPNAVGTTTCTSPGGNQAPVLTHLTWSTLMLRYLPPLFAPKTSPPLHR